ncbi:hypothetical protein P9314_05235 [Paenibacillus validus]|uniref:hypothetical protein n=1 Tax=Paenibacillus validus TaxID=44253 RepID=UPI000FD868D7|nr:hypothetical protein [Paenibacillus validus]MED4600113.1 hypothetical protein [Paenibacillus validus]MED4605560.1 hypothetical protein [Paenibacillus validus]
MFNKGPIEYNKILAKTSKEFVIVIKRTMKFEKLQVIESVIGDHRQGVDVALIAADRLLILRGYKVIKTAHIQEFKLDVWQEWTGNHGKKVGEFLRYYHENVQPLEDAWLKAM